MRVLVCGGRNFGAADRPQELPKSYREAAEAIAARQRAFINAVLDALPDRDQLVIIHGAAPGADGCAAAWASANGVATRAFPADWKTHGMAAGPVRNRQMLDEGKPDLVIAFPGGAGTRNMVLQAQGAGVPVREVKP